MLAINVTPQSTWSVIPASTYFPSPEETVGSRSDLDHGVRGAWLVGEDERLGAREFCRNGRTRRLSAVDPSDHIAGSPSCE